MTDEENAMVRELVESAHNPFQFLLELPVDPDWEWMRETWNDPMWVVEEEE